MLDQLNAQPADALLALIQLYAEDKRDNKIDLGVGVFRDEAGGTPVFGAIKQAEKILLETQDSKSYLGSRGDMGFVRGLIPHIFGEGADVARIDGVQTPGGTGAVRLASDLLRAAGCTKIWMGTPSWPNHAQILKAVGIEAALFRHMDVTSQQLDFAALCDSLDQAKPGEALLLHGCCHNPTGSDYSAEQWQEIARKCAEKSVIPLIDLAYHGLGQGFAEDAAGPRAVLEQVPEALVAYSCDKNFGLYRERVGALYVVNRNTASLPAIMSNVNALARSNWSMPPDHGAASVRIILEDAKLTANWQEEVRSMRARIRSMRDLLAANGQIGTVDLGAVGLQNGMFSTLNIDKDKIARLREEFGVYMAGSGRVNIAGFTQANIPQFIAGLQAVAG